ncbi:MAG: zinc ribbon domain-containing protein, partial [Burkholderiales bacterium]
CAACGCQKEFLQKLSDAPLKDCPECGKPALNKMVTAAGFQLKGSGWYATDFKHGASKQADKSDTKTEAKAESKAESKSESKSEDKSAAKTDAKPAAESPSKKSDAPAATGSSTTPAAGS